MNERGFRMMEGGQKNNSKEDEHEKAIGRYDEQNKLMRIWIDYPDRDDLTDRLYLYGTTKKGDKPQVLIWIDKRDGDELAARRIAQLANEFGGEVVVKRYEKPAPVVPAEKKPEREPTERELKEKAFRLYAREWSCDEENEPDWSIEGKNLNGKIGTAFWITPREGDRLAAERIAKMMNELGAKVRVEKTKWNGKQNDKPEDLENFEKTNM